MTLKGWSASYADGAVYTFVGDNTVDFAALPTEGLQLLVLFNEINGVRGREFISGCDWYWPFQGRESKQWNGSYVPKPKGVKNELLKKGTMISDATFKAIWAKAWAVEWL